MGVNDWGNLEQRVRVKGNGVVMRLRVNLYCIPVSVRYSYTLVRKNLLHCVHSIFWANYTSRLF